MTIPIAGLDSSGMPPGIFVEVDFAAGAASSGNATYAILLLGNKTSAGSATAGTAIYGPTSADQLTSLDDAKRLFGIGSELYRMYKRVLSVNTQSPIFAVVVTESVGAKASKDVTLATTATADGALRVFVADEQVDVAIATGDTASNIAANAAAKINAQIDWPVTATSSSGVLTITAQQKGPRGNWLRVGTRIVGVGVGTTTDTAPMVFLAGGTTLDSYTTPLSTIAPYRYYYIVSADDGGQSSTNLSALLTQVLSQATATKGIRQTVCAASCDGTSANVVTQATGINNPRLVPYVYLPYSDVPPCELAAIAAGARAFVERAFSAATLNFDGFGTTILEGVGNTSSLWPVSAPRSGAQLTGTQITSLLNNGVSPVGVDAFGRTYLASLITSKSQTASAADYRIRDGHKVSIADRFGDDAKAAASAQLSGKAIGDDPKDGQRPIAGVATKRLFRALLSTQIGLYGRAGLLDDPDAIAKNTVVVRESSPATRLAAQVPLATADVLHQVAILVSQVS